MRDFELDLNPSGAGKGGGGGGGFYHVSFRSGSRGGGACAGAAHDYITREGEFDEPDRDEAVYRESGNMPEWAKDDARAYWDAADLYERANGRLYVAGDFALPRGLSADDQVELARDFVEELTDSENLPYTFAIHAGHNRDGEEHNPHVHVMISERQNDKIERRPQDWFRRANGEHPERGGARKSRTFHGHDWVERARERLADSINEKLHELRREERVDHRSYDRQGVDREPGEHFGPSAPHMLGRGHPHDRLDDAGQVQDHPHLLADLDRRIGRLEAIRDSIVLEDDLSDRKSWSPSGGDLARDDDSRGR